MPHTTGKGTDRILAEIAVLCAQSPNADEMFGNGMLDSINMDIMSTYAATTFYTSSVPAFDSDLLHRSSG